MRLPGLAEALRSVDRSRERALMVDGSGRSAFSAFFGAAGPPCNANLVFQGGGVLGIAHLGFLHGLERAGVYAAGVAGTSAGAIVATLIAAARTSSDMPVAESLVPILWRMPASSFIDGPYRVRRLIKYALGQKGLSTEMLLPIWSSFRRVLRTYGLNTGNSFSEWMTNVLERDCGVRTVAELEDRLALCASSMTRTLASNGNAAHIPATAMLRVIATGLPQANVPIRTGVKLTFPEDLRFFAPRYRSQSPALFTRASMSIPVFFEPVTLRVDREKWRRYVHGLENELNATVLKDLENAASVAFVDGGLLSNFPIDAFLHAHQCGGLAQLPTIGVALAGDRPPRERPRRGSVAAGFVHAASVIDAMRHVRDRDAKRFAEAIDAHPGVNVRVALVDVGAHDWLDFQLDQSDASNLFVRGVHAAAELFGQLPMPRNSNE